MQTLKQERDSAPQAPTSHEQLVRGILASQAATHAEEVRLLRRRVAVLESALASKAPSQPGPKTGAKCQDVATANSEFSTPLAPAVVAAATKPVPTPESTPVPDPAFALAWSQGEATSFEERVAEKAFFQSDTIDEPARKWLLKN